MVTKPAASVMRERHFLAMNTGVAAWLWGVPGIGDIWLGEIQAFFAEVEAELSRFLLGSGLSRLNAAAGAGPQRVSDLLQRVLALALRHAAETGGLFDPTILPVLRAAGYDRSFEQVAAGGPASPVAALAAAPGANRLDWTAVEMNPGPGTVTLPAGMAIDLGGIAKGWTVDRAAEMLAPWGAALVDAGGDIRASAPPGGKPWPVAIDDPFHPGRDLALVELTDNAVVTSTIGRRQWQRDGVTYHHLIDPRTAAPAESDLHTVTVVGPTAAGAEVAAKVALLLGRGAGGTFLRERGYAGLLVGRDGVVETVGTPARFRLLAGRAAV